MSLTPCLALPDPEDATAERERERESVCVCICLFRATGTCNSRGSLSYLPSRSMYMCVLTILTVNASVRIHEYMHIAMTYNTTITRTMTVGTKITITVKSTIFANY